jgi:hypothetical protein
MKKFLDRILGLDDECSIWVDEEDLGKDKAFFHQNKSYFIRIPEKIDQKITLRLRGLGKKRRNKTGDLFLHVWLNKGLDVNRNLWLSETSARNGANKRLLLDGKAITMVIPPKSYTGLTIRLVGFGREGNFYSRAPALRSKKRGNALVKLFVFPDSITPNYGSFEALSTDNMALEGWVYRKIDKVIGKVGRSFFPVKPISADTVADLLNEWGWRSIFQALVDHLNLADFNIELANSNSISRPGICERTAIVQNNTPIGYKYKITINEQFLDNPFSIAAILAHELCHIVYSEKIEKIPRTTGYILRTDKATLEEEHSVDLLVFMFKIGEFQLRVARDKRLTLGYFNQEIFERIHVIVSRKLNSF